MTNGVHVPTWRGADADHLWTELCGKERWRGDLESLEPAVRRADDQQIWKRTVLPTCGFGRIRQATAEQAAGRLRRSLLSSEAEPVLNPQTLTLGFARRFATYKRATLFAA